MSGREQDISGREADEERIRAVVLEFFADEHPDQVEDAEDLFDFVAAMIDNETYETAIPGDRTTVDPAFFAGSLVTSVIWSAFLLYRQALQKGVDPEQRIEEILAELTGNPEMILKLSQRIRSLLASLEPLSESLGEAPQLRILKHKNPPPPTETSAAEASSDPTLAPLRPLEASAATGNEPDLLLFVEPAGLDHGRHRLQFRLHSTLSEQPLVYAKMGAITLERSLDDYLASFFQEIQPLHFPGNATREAQDRLKRLGEKLMQQLLPSELTSKLIGFRDQAKTLIIYSEEAIPWELLRFRDRPDNEGAFLGEAFALTSWFTGQPAIFRLPTRHIALIRPQNELAAAKTETAAIHQLGGPDRVVDPLPSRKREILGALGRIPYDIVHFIGHGMSAPATNPDLGALALDGGEKLDGLDIREKSLPGRPLVVLNACHSGRTGKVLTGLGGLAKAFIDGGAAAVVGCHWAVQDELAAAFSEELYRNLFAGLPLALAVQKARLHLQKLRPGDPTWLAYTVFGQPLAADAGSQAT